MTDEEKLEITKEAFRRKLDAIPTWTAFKMLMNSITKAQIITFVTDNLEQRATNYRDASTGMTTKADDIDDLVVEVDAI